MTQEEREKFKERIIKLSFGMDDSSAVKYFGVPRTTYANWLQCRRDPNATAIRLVEILELLQLLAPGINDHLKNEAMR